MKEAESSAFFILSQEQGDQETKIYWWYYIGFPIFGLLLEAKWFICLLEYVHNWLNTEKLIWMYNVIKKFSIQIIVW